MVKTTPDITRIIRKYITNLQARGATIDRVILCGSYEDGKDREHSDIDIAVISPFFRGQGIRERQEFLGMAFGDIYDPIEALGHTPEEYENPEPGTMLHEIIRTGKVIYRKSLS